MTADLSPVDGMAEAVEAARRINDPNYSTETSRFVVDAVRVADALISLVEKEGEWRSIEEAPKDGTPILGRQDGEDDCVMRWAPYWKEWQSVPGAYRRRPTQYLPIPPKAGKGD